MGSIEQIDKFFSLIVEKNSTCITEQEWNNKCDYMKGIGKIFHQNALKILKDGLEQIFPQILEEVRLKIVELEKSKENFDKLIEDVLEFHQSLSHIVDGPLARFKKLSMSIQFFESIGKECPEQLLIDYKKLSKKIKTLCTLDSSSIDPTYELYYYKCFPSSPESILPRINQLDTHHHEFLREYLDTHFDHITLSQYIIQKFKRVMSSHPTMFLELQYIPPTGKRRSKFSTDNFGLYLKSSPRSGGRIEFSVFR